MMRCLETGFVACGPQTEQACIVEHFLLQQTNFGVSCGRQAQLYSLADDDSNNNGPAWFPTERLRTDLEFHLPWMAWKAHPVQRSLDALRSFSYEMGLLVWRGVQPTYPVLVPRRHLVASKASRLRQALLFGDDDLQDFTMILKTATTTNHGDAQHEVSQQVRTGATKLREKGTWWASLWT